MVREGRVLIAFNTDPDFGANYYVTAYEVGAQVTTGGTVNSVVVRAGHGFATGDKFIVSSSGVISTAQFKTVHSSSDATHIVCTGGETVTVSAGDFLINLGADTGSATPNYDGNGLAIYTDMAYGSQATNNTVQCNANGRYRYFHKGIAIWELVRSTLTVPFDLYLDASVGTVVGPDSTTDNHIVRWDGTTGELIQDASPVTVSDAGAVSGVTSLSAASMALTAGATVGTTLDVTGAATAASLVTSGVVTAGGNLTSGGHLRGLKATQALTTNVQVTTLNRFICPRHTHGSDSSVVTSP